MGQKSVTLPVIEYFDLVRRAASWNAIVAVARNANTVSSEVIHTLEKENIKEYMKEVKE